MEVLENPSHPLAHSVGVESTVAFFHLVQLLPLVQEEDLGHHRHCPKTSSRLAPLIFLDDPSALHQEVDVEVLSLVHPDHPFQDHPLACHRQVAVPQGAVMEVKVNSQERMDLPLLHQEPPVL